MRSTSTPCPTITATRSTAWLVAQSRIEGLPIISRELALAPYGVDVVW